MVPSVPLDLVDAHRLDAAQIDVVASPQHRHLHGAKDARPTGLKSFGNLLPAQALGPSRQEPGERRRQVVLALRPRNGLDVDSASPTVGSAPGVDEEDLDPPQGDKLVPARLTGIVAGATLPAAGTEGPAVGARTKSDFQDDLSELFREADRGVDEARLLFELVQDSLQLHPVLLRVDDGFVPPSSQNRERGASPVSPLHVGRRSNPCQVAPHHRHRRSSGKGKLRCREGVANAGHHGEVGRRSRGSSARSTPVAGPPGANSNTTEGEAGTTRAGGRQV